MREDITDDLHIFDEADDPHSAFAFRTDQRINLVYFLNKTLHAFLSPDRCPGQALAV